MELETSEFSAPTIGPGGLAWTRARSSQSFSRYVLHQAKPLLGGVADFGQVSQEQALARLGGRFHQKFTIANDVVDWRPQLMLRLVPVAFGLKGRVIKVARDQRQQLFTPLAESLQIRQTLSAMSSSRAGFRNSPGYD